MFGKKARRREELDMTDRNILQISFQPANSFQI